MPIVMAITALITKKKKRRKKGEDFVIEGEGSDHPVHESYTEEEPVKE